MNQQYNTNPKRRRVVVTGMGVVAPNAHGLEEYEAAIEAAGFEAICVAEKNRLTFPASAITRTSTRVCYPPGKIPDRPF